MVRDNVDKPNNLYFEDDFSRIFSPDQASQVINSDEYRFLFTCAGNSIIACAIVGNIPSSIKSLNVFLVYALHLLQQLASNTIGSEKINDSTIIIPKDIFPLPPVKKNEQGIKRRLESRKKIFERARKKAEDAARNIDGNNNAIAEILQIVETSSADDMKETRGFILSPKTSEKISEETKQILRDHGLSTDEIDVTLSIDTLERAKVATAHKLRKNIQTGTTMVKIGSVLLPSDYFSSGLDIAENPDHSYLTLGACPPVPIVGEEPDGEVTIPIGHGRALAYAFSDLMIVEQSLSHYELSEIAHIENVLRSEIRTRELRTTKTREESELTETEETTEKTQDLSTTERYELGTESQHVINENRSTDAGITVNASYGPSVDITANFNHSSSTSSQDSKSASSNFARETTNRAINRIEKRKLQRRFVRTMEEVMERNKHIFKNDGADAADISGIYRWVDKVYEVRIVNYGKRFMLEFIVPEPASFYRYAMSKLPEEVNKFVKPDPPGYCISDGKTFHPLVVQDITRESYLDWVSKYNVQDVSPPPNWYITVSQQKIIKNDELKTVSILGIGVGVADGYFDIPDGYIPLRANINLQWDGFDNGYMNVQVQTREVRSKEMAVGGAKGINLYRAPTSTIPYTINSFGFFQTSTIVTVLCELSPEKFDEWKMNTYNSIMNSYNAQKSRYDDAVSSTLIRKGYSEIKGKNPLYNRETEKLELKKGCISILTGQDYEAFDAVKKNVAPYGYPEIDFDKVIIDGEYIRRFEQAFEWNNMTYLFYPYFWGTKEDWPIVSKLDDEDPLFARFLQAGAARVVVPVRPGFEMTIIDYLGIENNWNAEGTILTEGNEIDPFFLSIVDEIKSQTGNNSVDGKGTLQVTENSAHVIGTDTAFSENDVNRRIIIKSKTYVIKQVHSETEIDLTFEYKDENDDKTIYSLGGILVGQAWQIKLPTNLVKLDTEFEIY